VIILCLFRSPTINDDDDDDGDNNLMATNYEAPRPILLSYFLHPSATSSVSGSDILLSILFSSMLNLYSSLRINVYLLIVYLMMLSAAPVI
jgi:hypothetical protein